MIENELGPLTVNSLVDGRMANRIAAPSVLLACIGDAFMSGVSEAAKAAIQRYSGESKASCEMFVLPNLTVLPPLGLGAMRNFMVRRAWLLNYDYLMLLDNDVILAEDTIIKLVAHGKAYITPWYDQSPFRGDDIPIVVTEPMLAKNQGLQSLRWTVPWCNLIRTDIFRVVGFRPFTESMIYHEDCFNSSLFRCYGLDIWQDTDAHVKLLRGPRMLWEHMTGGDGKLKICKPFEKP